MKMSSWIRFCLIILSLAMVLSLFACGNGENETTEAPTTDATETPTVEPTEEPTTEEPTEAPTEEPTTEEPTTVPTEEPTTEEPTETVEEPTTEEPTDEPTEEPTTEEPTEEPTEETTEEETIEVETATDKYVDGGSEEETSPGAPADQTVPFYYANLDVINNFTNGATTSANGFITIGSQADLIAHTINIKGWICTATGVYTYVAHIIADDGTEEWIDVSLREEYPLVADRTAKAIGAYDRSDVLKAIRDSYPGYVIADESDFSNAETNAAFNLTVTLDPAKWHGKTVTVRFYAVNFKEDAYGNIVNEEGKYLPLVEFVDAMPEHVANPSATFTDNGDGTHSFDCVVCGEKASEGHRDTGELARWVAEKNSYYTYCKFCNANVVKKDYSLLLDETTESVVRASGNYQGGYGVTKNSDSIVVSDSSVDGGWGGAPYSQQFTNLGASFDVGQYFIIRCRVPAGGALNDAKAVNISLSIQCDSWSSRKDVTFQVPTDGEYRVFVIDWKTILEAPETEISQFWMQWYGDLNAKALEIDYAGFSHFLPEVEAADCAHPDSFRTNIVDLDATNHSFVCSLCGGSSVGEHTYTVYQGIWNENYDNGADIAKGAYVTYCSLCKHFGEDVLPLNVYLSAEMLANPMGGKTTPVLELSEDGTYMTYTNQGSDANFVPYKNGGTFVSGKYLVVKYRGASSNGVSVSIYSSSNNSTAPVGGHNSSTSILGGDNWHYLIFDMTSKFGPTIWGEENGEYSANYLRFTFGGNGETIDIAYAGFADSIEHIIAGLQLTDATLADDCDHPVDMLDNESIQYNDGATHTIHCNLCNQTATLPHDAAGIAVWDADFENADGSVGAYVKQCATCKSSTTETTYANLVITPEILYGIRGTGAGAGTKTAVLSEDQSYVTYTATAGWQWGGNYAYAMVDSFHAGLNPNGLDNGKYMVVKYRANEDSPNPADIKFSFTTTAGGNGNYNAADGALIATVDEGWKVVVVDLTKFMAQYPGTEDGVYAINGSRLYVRAGTIVDIAYIAFADDIDNLCVSLAKHDAALEGACAHSELVYDTDSIEYKNADVHTVECKLCGEQIELAHSNTTFQGKWVESEKAYYTYCTVCGGTTDTEVMFNVYLDPAKIKAGSKSSTTVLTLSDDGSYVTYTRTGDDAWFLPYSFVDSNNGSIESGKYIVIKYRGLADDGLAIPFYSSSVTLTKPTGAEYRKCTATFGGADWHYLIVDMNALVGNEYWAEEDGKFSANYLRLAFDVEVDGAGVDVAYIGFADTLDHIYATVQANDTTVADDCDHPEIAWSDAGCALCGWDGKGENFNVYWNAEAIADVVMLTNFEMTLEDGYVSFDFAVTDEFTADQFADITFNSEGALTGKYLTFEYRIATGNSTGWTVYIESTNGGAGDVYPELVADGEWHTVTIDLEAAGVVVLDEALNDYAVTWIGFSNYGYSDNGEASFDISSIGLSTEDPNA